MMIVDDRLGMCNVAGNPTGRLFTPLLVVLSSLLVASCSLESSDCPPLNIARVDGGE